MSDSGSASTTNPNTPRSAKEEVAWEEEVPHEEVLQKEIEEEGLNPSYKTTTTSSPGTGSDHDLHPTWPKSLDVTDTLAMATWAPSGDASLGNLWFDLHWHRQLHVAFFTLRTSVRMPRKKKTRARTGSGGARVVYIYIYPERIRALSLWTNPAKQPLGAGSLLLRFVLDKPLALVMPTMLGGDNNDEDLSTAGCPDIFPDSYRHIQEEAHGETAARALFSSLRYRAVFLETTCQDRHTVPRARRASCGGSRSGASASLHDSKGKKRLRLDSPDSQDSFTSESTKSLSLKAMRALLGDSLSSFKQELTQELRQELKQNFDESLAAHKTQVAEILAAHKQDMAEKLQQTEARIVSMVRNEFGDYWDNMEQTMMDMVLEEVAEVREDIMQNITEQQLTATLTFTHHPMY